MLRSSVELSKLHIGAPPFGPMLPCGASVGTQREVHEQRNKSFRSRAVGCTRLGAHLAPHQYVDLGLAEHAASVRCQRGGRLPRVMAPQFPAGFQPGTFIPACRNLVDSGRLLADRDRPSSGGRYGIHVGYALRVLHSAAFLFSHCFAHRPALGAANPWLPSPSPGIANRDYGSIAHFFAISISRPQHEFCVSGSFAAPCVGVSSVTFARYSRGMHSDFLLADAPPISACFSPGAKI